MAWKVVLKKRKLRREDDTLGFQTNQTLKAVEGKVSGRSTLLADSQCSFNENKYTPASGLVIIAVHNYCEVAHKLSAKYQSVDYQNR